MNTFFTADTHLFHQKAVGFRGFRDVAEMHYVLVNAWNARVGQKDTVFHLGDLSFGRVEDTIAILRCLKGQINIVPGNHDRPKDLAKIAQELAGRFKVLDPLVTAKVTTHLPGGENLTERVVLCHFPLLVWDRAHYGVPHLHGHSHGNCRYPDTAARLDVGVDACSGKAPTTWEEVKARLASAALPTWDHHKP